MTDYKYIRLLRDDQDRCDMEYMKFANTYIDGLVKLGYKELVHMKFVDSKGLNDPGRIVEEIIMYKGSTEYICN